MIAKWEGILSWPFEVIQFKLCFSIFLYLTSKTWKSTRTVKKSQTLFGTFWRFFGNFKVKDFIFIFILFSAFNYFAICVLISLLVEKRSEKNHYPQKEALQSDKKLMQEKKERERVRERETLTLKKESQFYGDWNLSLNVSLWNKLKCVLFPEGSFCCLIFVFVKFILNNLRLFGPCF